MKNKEVSNRLLTDICARRPDACYRFVVVGRADCLPLPVNVQLLFQNRRDEPSHRYALNRRPKRAHILNWYTMNFGWYTARHNELINVIRAAAINYMAEDLCSDIQLRMEMRENGLTEELESLKPDIFVRHKNHKQ
jgi:hypothetical protein